MELNDNGAFNIPTTAVTYKFVDLKIPSSVPIITDTIMFILIDDKEVQDQRLVSDGFSITPGTIIGSTPEFDVY
jgi:hypothetical protein